MFGGNESFKYKYNSIIQIFSHNFIKDIHNVLSDITAYLVNVKPITYIKAFIENNISTFLLKTFTGIINIFNILVTDKYLSELMIESFPKYNFNIYEIVKDKDAMKKFAVFLNENILNIFTGIKNQDLSQVLIRLKEFTNIDNILLNNLLPFYNVYTKLYEKVNYSFSIMASMAISIKNNSNLNILDKNTEAIIVHVNDDNDDIIDPVKNTAIVKNIEFKESYYDLDIISLKRDNKYIDFIYKPSPIYIENVDKLNNRILQEYLETYNLFKNIRICNHNNNYNHRLSFSINGRLYNRPDREYYIVMNDNYNFNIQVYKLDPKNKREKMLFGIWMNVTSGDKNVISEPFFL